jgi:peptide/nickel transport system ATP-binding protein
MTDVLRPESARSPAPDPVLEVRDLHIDRHLNGHARTIVSSVSLRLAARETIGIVGESGSGKSMTARAIIGLLPSGLTATGEVLYAGRNLLSSSAKDRRAVRGGDIAMILQDPFTMLHPTMRCGQIIGESLPPGHRRTRAERRAEAVQRLAEVGIRDPAVADQYPFQLSGGMRQRVAIAAALARGPQVLIADEPSTALDASTQREVLALIKQIQQAREMSVVLITHDLRVAFAMCDRIYVLYAGSIVEVGPSSEVEGRPLHPYTDGLLASEPPADRRVRRLVAIDGTVPAPGDVMTSCTFAPRCPWVTAACRSSRPPLLNVAPGRASACARIADITTDMSDRRTRAEAIAAPDVPRPAPLISVRDATKTFESGRRTVQAVKGVTIEIGAHESVGLVGQSGSGKTTLARMLVGLETSSGGEIVINGIALGQWHRLTARDRAKLRSTVQIVFQDPYSSLNPKRSVGWTLRNAISVHNPRVKDLDRRVADLLRTVGLRPEYGQRKPSMLSGGERQRVAIARALAPDPNVLICDEPVSALDMSVQAQIINLFTRLRADRDLSYLFITHDLSVVRQVADYLYVMHNGQVVESGPAESVLNAPQQAYTRHLISSVPRSEATWLSDQSTWAAESGQQDESAQACELPGSESITVSTVKEP